jgi:hypothetical protein
MPTEQTQAVMTWIEVLREYWPIWAALFAAIGAVGELRVRRLLDAHEAQWKADWEKEKAEFRTEMQKPVSDAGETGLEALTMARAHDRRLVDLETKTAVFWKMIERSTVGLLRHVGKDEDS